MRRKFKHGIICKDGSKWFYRAWGDEDEGEREGFANSRDEAYRKLQAIWAGEESKEG